MIIAKHILKKSSKNTMIRAFLAVDLPFEAKKKIMRAVDVLDSSGKEIRWVSADQMHLTVKFLGDVAEENIDHISSAMEEVSLTEKPFSFTTGEIGVFPAWRDPKVIWIGIDSGVDELTVLNEKVESALSLYGFARDRKKFTPHVTIGRIKRTSNIRRLRKLVEDNRVERSLCEVDHIVLFRSDLTKNRAVHTPIMKYRFQA